MTCNKETIGWRCWYDDGSEAKGSTFDDWCKLAISSPENCLVKVLYYCDVTKQIQTADWWYEAPHKRGVIRATCSDKKKPDIEKRYPDAVFIEGFWTVDEWFTECREAAMASSYGSNIPTN